MSRKKEIHSEQLSPRVSFPRKLLANIKRNWILYLMILPVVAYYIVFAYVPMYGIQIAWYVGQPLE